MRVLARLCANGLWAQQTYGAGMRPVFHTYKILNKAFLLGLNIDVNQEITSKPSIFDLNNFVNQKRLTKSK